MNRLITAALAAALFCATTASFAADTDNSGVLLAQMDDGGHDMSGMIEGDGSAASQALLEANDRMHRDMAIDYSDNVDVDFVRSMIPHHQGAIDMARVQLEHGKDPEIRKIAEEIIAAQEAEIEQLKSWLNAHDK